MTTVSDAVRRELESEPPAVTAAVEPMPAVVSFRLREIDSSTLASVTWNPDIDNRAPAAN
jgi:hypothetical protein